ncbi:hypothetical protein NF717_11215 [Lactococcus formosensis]|uniref:Uncharacterized protein n=2 Tax=Lactococcus formosensis TaxID=1281486 RepID=A0A9X4NYW1_9LACT|nr:hypothetical protein [Lactococcus formosensis]MDG6111550.1 hypothetical protein [Lactococcus formosensis]MDG6117750.1 hypothetical protein [Lactococcus formosensis]MDG6146209.1 hypothetical protein [Lactococcus formosensis]MDG6153319.1 hypothetical protein [Lactococcus formosensis]MDG6164215.1 hypothetical protein [Lactococcus formosensis]
MKSSPTEIVAGSYLPDAKNAKKMSDKERKKAQEKEVDESKFTLSIYPEATFEDGKSTGAIYIKNDVKNAYPIAVQIVEDKSGDIIYESGAIEPGFEITEGELNKNLKKGTYKCTAEVSIYDPQTKKYKGQTAAEIEVEVKN